MRILWVAACVACHSEPQRAPAEDGQQAAPPVLAAPVGSGSASSALPRLLPHGGLSFEIIDDATGQRMPGKLTLTAAPGTKDLVLSKDIGVEADGSLEAYNRVFSLSGVGVVAVPLGTYDVTVSRGIEWTISTERVTITAAGVEVHARLKHVIDTPHWLSGDFHVHAASSPDSRVPMRDRVYEFTADGVDMIVSTDHNVVSDYAPVIAELHAEKLLASATGDEITTTSWGHFGAFPLPPELEAEGHGAIPVRGKTPNELFTDVHKRAPDSIIDVHHPRLTRGIGYFFLGRFDDTKDEASRKGFSYDFDAIEILNGYQDTERKSIDRVMTDWFALLDRGHLVTATGNSDTHHLHYNLGGYPRNYVLVDNDDPGTATVGDVAKSIKAHHAFFTTGPFVDLSVGSATIGDLAPAPDGKATATIVVRAAPWVSVSRVILYVAGKEVTRWTVPESQAVERFRKTYDLQVPNDTYVVARVEGDASLFPVVGGGKDHNVLPFALTNPILLDANTNGTYDPALPHGSHVAHAVADEPAK